MERYERQILLDRIGVSGQEKLSRARVTVVGAGGLGSPVLTYLTEAGVGNIRVIDCDTVSLTNLNRQYLHGEKDLGREKTVSALEKLSSLNSEIRLEGISRRLNTENAEELIGNASVVVDCVDNVATRLIVNEVCIRKGIPLVEGGVKGFYGFVTVVSEESACLECLGYNSRMDGNITPVLGVTAGVIGALQASECLKLLLETGETLAGRLLQYDGLTGSFDEIEVLKRENCGLHARAEQGMRTEKGKD